MPKSPYAPCIPTRGTKVPSHSDWIHEVKQDGLRLIVSRDGDRVRLFTRNGYDWTSRYPLIVEAARRIRTQQFVLDGEAVLLGVDGISDFDGLYSEKHNEGAALRLRHSSPGWRRSSKPLPALAQNQPCPPASLSC